MKLAITRTDGGVSIMTLAVPEGAYLLRTSVLEKWKELNPGAYVSHREISDEEIPTDRTFRDAWEDSGQIMTNMDKARGIHCDRLRALRKPLLAALDVEYARADEKGDSDAKAEIAAKKKALRDVTQDPMVNAAKTPDELKQAIPAILKAEF